MICVKHHRLHPFGVAEETEKKRKKVVKGSRILRDVKSIISVTINNNKSIKTCLVCKPLVLICKDTICAYGLALREETNGIYYFIKKQYNTKPHTSTKHSVPLASMSVEVVCSYFQMRLHLSVCSLVLSFSLATGYGLWLLCSHISPFSTVRNLLDNHSSNCFLHPPLSSARCGCADLRVLCACGAVHRPFIRFAVGVVAIR